MQTISNNGGKSGSASSRTLDNAKDVARKFGTNALADSAVTAPKIASGAVAAADIADGSVSTAKLADGGVTTAKLGARAVTGAKLDPAGLKCASFAGVAAAGPITLTGAVIGDRVLAIFQIDAAGAITVAAQFEAVISVNDQIQQTAAADLSTHKYAVILIPAAA